MKALLAVIADRCQRVRWKGSEEFTASCPNHLAHKHGDRNKSFSARATHDRVLLKCHGGCTIAEICASIKMEERELFLESKKGNGHHKVKPLAEIPTPKIIDEYEYLDERGVMLFESLRMEPKTFRQRRPVNGGWEWNLHGVRLVLYNLPAVVEAETVYVVEGEKDVITMREKFGRIATTNPMGAGKWKDEYSESLRGKVVVVIPDNDKPGLEHAHKVAASLHGIAKHVAICQLPEKVKDVSDWPFSKDAFIEYLDQFSVAWTPPIGGGIGCSVAELFTAQEQKVDWLVWPLLAPGFATILDALPKMGKTEFWLRGILASLQGKHFLGYPTRPARVIYVSEQSRGSLATQMRYIGFTGQEPPDQLWIVTREDWTRWVYAEFLEQLEKNVIKDHGYNALLVDTFHSVARLEDENDASEVNTAGNATVSLATRYNMGLGITRHDRKSGGEIGVSGRSSIQLSGIVDNILHLVRVPTSSTERKLEIRTRVPGLPAAQLLNLVDGEYVNHGDEGAGHHAQAIELEKFLTENPNASYRSIAFQMKMSKNRVNELAQEIGWTKDEEAGKWRKV
jgi:5S rRNA maturation endonuclease (ribonuclease M5)